ncbi:hypothetical protein DIPPA_34554 [Diplonema papillatum]|nr:hypothetical protein DIPPA_34554 [Diplonema papillatum]
MSNPNTPSPGGQAQSKPEKRTIHIRDGDSQHVVSWYGLDVPADEIRKTICITLGLDIGTDFVLEDEARHSIVVCATLPSGLRFSICY